MRQSPKPCDRPRSLWPSEGMTSSSRRAALLLASCIAWARWLLSKPPKLEAAKRHPVGHLKLRFPWPTHCVTARPHLDSLSRDSPPALLDKLQTDAPSQLLKPVFSQVGGGGRRPRKPEALRGTAPRTPPGGARAPGPKAKNQKRVGPAAPPLPLIPCYLLLATCY
jgi:hypothetical protein